MSNFDSTKKTKPLAKEIKQTSARKRWSYIQSDLGNAASEWQQAESQPVVKTQDEEQLEKVKSIIENLKEKLNEF